ncbi:MAG: TIGR04282 family arsenosugar biosynthesis glycosyltransferase, partial [Planctomycetota bacterium]
AVGCDVPGMRPMHLQQCAAALQNHDVVIGPASDGGYWLIGLRQDQPQLFSDMSWGGAQVAAETRRRCRALGLKRHELAVLADVDRPEDLPVWQAVADERPH